MNAHDSLLEKAAQCRRLAAGLLNEKEPAKNVLLALAKEFEREAARPRIEDASQTAPV